MNLCTKHSSLFSLFPSEDLRHYASSYTITDATWTKQKSWQFNRKHWHPCICCQPVAQLQESHYFKPIEQNWKWKSNECHKRKKNDSWAPNDSSSHRATVSASWHHQRHQRYRMTTGIPFWSVEQNRTILACDRNDTMYMKTNAE